VYFINLEKCNICGQKKSVATNRESNQRACFDCNTENYNFVARKQKDYWIHRKKSKSNSR